MKQFGMRMFAIFKHVGSFHEDQNDTLGLGIEGCFWVQENTEVGAYKVKLSLQANNQLWAAP